MTPGNIYNRLESIYVCGACLAMTFILLRAQSKLHIYVAFDCAYVYYRDVYRVFAVCQRVCATSIRDTTRSRPCTESHRRRASFTADVPRWTRRSCLIIWNIALPFSIDDEIAGNTRGAFTQITPPITRAIDFSSESSRS